MTFHLLERQFANIGARVKLRTGSNQVSINIRGDREGEYFDIAANATVVERLVVLHSRPRLRHLVLMSRDETGKHKFLCGHDERHWFVAALPEAEAISTVATAMEALKPTHVRLRQDRLAVKARQRNQRRNQAFVRQGEWFFVPADPTFQPRPFLILTDEPLRRGRGKPHFVDELVRVGGESVYVNWQFPGGLTQQEYDARLRNEPALSHLPWRVMRRNPQVFVRGRVRHTDHKTIILDGWHEVLMNTETQSVAMRHVAFLD